MTELEKALSGEQFSRRDPEVIAFQNKVKDLCYEFNNTVPSSPRRKEILSELVEGYNEYLFVESGFQCIMGKNIHFKGMAFVNLSCTFLDSNIITIGHCALIGPGCSLICTNHSIDPVERLKGVFNDRPITIGENAWLGANVTVLPGVTIGDRTVIGAGSVVTHDIPADCIAVGNPCRIVRKIAAEQ